MDMRKIILIGGAPLSGKSTLASELSKKLQISWVSTDDIRKWMEALVRKEDYPDLFYGDGLDAIAFYEKFKTPDEVFRMENKQGDDVQKGVRAMIESFWWWDKFIIEGIAITPAFVKQFQDAHQDIAIIPVFIVDTDRENIKMRLEKRGLWDDANTYPDYITPLELEWTILFNNFYQTETAKYDYEVSDIKDIANTIDQIITLFNNYEATK